MAEKEDAAWKVFYIFLKKTIGVKNNIFGRVFIAFFVESCFWQLQSYDGGGG